MRYLSVCSGIEAASVAWQPLGWTPAAFSEIEPFPCALLKHHYPDVPNFGDMTQFKEWPTRDELSIDLLCGGTPCQSFSVAGLRGGLDDPRGNLMLTYLAIADKYRPEWLVWENVPGVLSSNGGRDFGTFLGGLGQLGYGFAYRILDAQFFGVPQRRRRVFVVANLRCWQRAAAVLFERHSLSGHPAPRRETRKELAGTLGARTGRSVGAQDAACGHLIPQKWPAEIASCLNAHFGDKQGLEDQHINGGASLFVPAVTHSLLGEGHDASEDGTGRGVPLVVDTLTSNGDAHSGLRDEQGLVAVNIYGGNKREDRPEGGFYVRMNEQTTKSLDTSGGLNPACSQGGTAILAFDQTQITSAQNRSNPQPGDPCHTLSKGMHAPAIAIQGTMINRSDTAGPAGSGIDESGISFTLTKNDQHAVQTAMQVRRLTPEECEALQGFPRSYTQVPNRNKPAADGPRYKALGNSWAVPCARWIGERIDAVNLTTKTTKDAA